jgi:hypothetical protein
MVSVVHNDITERLALRYPGTGLVQTVEQLEAYAGGEYNTRWFSNDDWMATVDDDKVDLRSTFRTGLFEGKRAFVEQDDSIRMLLGDDSDPDSEPDGFYPLYNRFGNQIPLEYLWAARGKLGGIAEDPEKPDFTPYRYRDGQGSEPIGSADIEALSLTLTKALQHVERAIGQKTGKSINKPSTLLGFHLSR